MSKLVTKTVSRSKSKLGYNPLDWWKRDSKSTISFNARYVILQNFLKFHKITAENLLILAGRTPSGKPQFAIIKMVEDYLDHQESRGYASSTIAKEAGIISGFLRANNVIIKIGKKYSLHTVYESRRILTQPEVRKMIKVTPRLEEKTVICLEAQTAQRIGILTALTWNMIHRYPTKGSNKTYGVVEVMPEISDRNGRQVNKTEMHYEFGLHWESMKLLDELKKQRKDTDPFIFRIDKRRMQEAITDAADLAGIQVETERKLKVVGKKKRKWHEIHAHVFRRFWMAQMDTAGTKNEKLLDYQLGHVIAYGGTYHQGMFTRDKIIAAIMKADKQLRVLP